MGDPQDLLYTNQFISTNILSESELANETNYYDRFTKYVNNETKNDIQEYIENNDYETSDINIDKTLNKPWPVGNKKNHYPLFDSYTNDISVNRYKKEIITKVNIDSRNRDIEKYPYPYIFSLPFPKVFRNIKKFVINDIICPNIIHSVSNYNNNLAWQYASENFLVNNNIDVSIIPVPDKARLVSYSSLPNSVYSYSVSAGSGNIPTLDNYLLYQTELPEGNYTVINMIKSIKYYTSIILHGSNISKNNTNIVEQPYLGYPRRLGTPHLFSTDINVESNAVKFVNRIEEVNISAFQTFSPYDTNFSDDDIFYKFSSQYLENIPYNLNNNYVYILVPAISDTTYQYYLNINCIYSPNAFPLVITNLDFSVGNIDPNIINYTPFYDIQIYLQNGYTEDELKSISYYKFIDTITFSINNNNKVYLRYGLNISLGTSGGKTYNVNGLSLKPCDSDTIILSESLRRLIDNYGNIVIPQSLSGTFINSTTTSEPGIINTNVNSTITTSGILTDYKYINQNILIGRALLFRWVFDKVDNLYTQYEVETNNVKKRSLLHTLAWPIANETYSLYTFDNNYGFRFIQTNYNSLYISSNSSNSLNTLFNNEYPQLSLNLQKYGNDYFFITNSYIYLKISFNTSSSTEDNNQIVNAVSSNILQYNQNYVINNTFYVGIGEDYTCINTNTLTVYRIDQYNIFAKILVSNNPGSTDTILSNIINNNSFNILYDNTLDNVDAIDVSIYDSSLKLLYTSRDFSFTLNIYEVKDVLKETLVNSKTNDVISNGNIFNK
jgi:hypothetical protein